MQFFKEDCDKCKEDASSIRVIRFVHSEKKNHKKKFYVLISQLLFPVQTFSEFTTKLFFQF